MFCTSSKAVTVAGVSVIDGPDKMSRSHHIEVKYKKK